ncbi:hypothetical protein [Microbulbifer yueqingensis]|uniref:Uncharacterized protein n=1 Tax=Microbulbifer yueqingensis TaxID=658219 RepID=A0A1G8UCV1_9GAMM|nr:hypothetical protein [Microbulbifer yueqingensis]SDJ51587.1 hypothetical protein SAMN05216212_0071 [Microbulbifer yueqingensis]
MNEQMLNLLQQQFSSRPELQGNPQLSAMMQALIERRSDPAPAVVEDRRLEQLEKSRARWKQYAKGLAETVRFFGDMLGACSLCWGEDSECPHCQGEGTIGSRAGDIERLLPLIEPVLAQAGLAVCPAPQGRAQTSSDDVTDVD